MSRLIDADDLPISSIDITDVDYYVSKYGQGIPAVYWEDIQDAPTVEPESQWIPCSERMPEEHGFYLVSVGSPYKHIRVYQYEPCTGYENENLWRGEDGSYCFNWFVEAWMPLPESWKGEQ